MRRCHVTLQGLHGQTGEGDVGPAELSPKDISLNIWGMQAVASGMYTVGADFRCPKTTSDRRILYRQWCAT
jgi:hypothetical protein